MNQMMNCIAAMLYLLAMVVHGANSESSRPSSATTYENSAEMVTEMIHPQPGPTAVVPVLPKLDDEIPMPMHRRFLQERKERKAYSVMSNDIVIQSSDPNHGDNNNRIVSSNPLKDYEYEHSTVDVLSSEWWVMLPEGQRKPETRRLHAAAVYSIPASKSGNGGGKANKGKAHDKDKDTKKPGNTTPAPTPSSSSESQPVPNNNNLNIDEDESVKEDLLPVGNETNVVDPPEATEPLNDNPNGSDDIQETTNAPIPTSTNQTDDENSNLRHSRHRNLQPDGKEPTNQEYMVVTGGFSDNDWENFPVWAYDMTSATLSEDGRWYELTPPRTMTDATYEDYCLSSNTTAVQPEKGWDDENAVRSCAPSPRVGHISVVRNDYVYVFGGLQYNDRDGIFFMEQEPYMYRMKLKQEKFQERDMGNYEGYYSYVANENDEDSMFWERITTNVITPPPNTCILRSNGKDCVVNRGEVRGGYWEKEDKLIIYGGLKVREYETSMGYEQQADTALGDVWAYDFKSFTWEMLAPTSSTTQDIPYERASHAATVVGDELVIYGGLRKDATYPWDGTTVWEQLDDIWVFNLRSHEWEQRPMLQSEGRSYQSVVGWEAMANKGTVLAAFGGYKTMMDPVDNQEVSYVYDDTLISLPPNPNITAPSVWWLAEITGIESTFETISTRLEHTAVLSPQYGNMIVWGGRYRSTNDISGIWSLNIAGSGSQVSYRERSDDHEMANVGFAYVVLVVVMMMSMMFTYMCGIIHRRVEAEEAMNLEALNADPTMGGTVFGRNGLSQDIIDTIPLKTFKSSVSIPGAEASSEENPVGANRSNENENANVDDFNYDDDEDENCCAICLIEYKEGDEIRCLPCGHEFHKECVDSWLANQASCPTCRYSLADLVSLSTRASIANTLRARIAATIAPNTSAEPVVQQSNEEQQQQQQQQPPRHNHQSPPSSPEAGIAPGVRTVQALRRMLHRRHRGRTVSSVPSNDSSISPPRATLSPRSSDDESIGGDLELAYSSSLEFTEDFELRNSYSSDSDLPIEGRRRRVRIGRDRRQMMRGRGRRDRRVRGGARSPLNAPLRPSDASIV